MLLDNDVVMMEEDDIIRYATELLDAVDNGWLNDDTKVDRFTYAHLVAMFLATSNMDRIRKNRSGILRILSHWIIKSFVIPESIFLFEYYQFYILVF